LAPPQLRTQLEKQLHQSIREYRHEEKHSPNCNVCPGNSSTLILDESYSKKDDGKGLILDVMKFGFTAGGHFMINKRCETLSGKWLAHRAVVVTSGYFEWIPSKPIKRPFFFFPPQNHPLKEKEEKEDEEKESKLLLLAAAYDPKEEAYVVLTQNATPDVEFIHDRMPVILGTPEEVDAWLQHGRLPVGSMNLKGRVSFYEVSPEAVNHVANKTTDCIRPLDLTSPAKKDPSEKKSTKPAAGQQGIKRFFTPTSNSDAKSPESKKPRVSGPNSQ
jgi:putative SOS response-associated peptidase YedK